MLPWKDLCQESIDLDELLLRELSTWAVFQEVSIPHLSEAKIKFQKLVAVIFMLSLPYIRINFSLYNAHLKGGFGHGSLFL